MTHWGHYTHEVDYWLETDLAPLYTMTKLDEIKVAGSIRLGVLMKAPIYQVTWIGRALRILTDDETFTREVVKIIDEEVLESLKRLKKAGGRDDGITDSEMKDLMQWNILRKLDKGERYTEVCQLFKVPKGPATSRLIMNAKRANARANKSPDFTLGTCEEVRRRMQELGPSWFVSGDLRHYFYQIRICTAFQKFLTVLGKTKSHHGITEAEAYAVRVLPMGHSWSPYLAQSVCWAIVMANAQPGQRTTGGDPREAGPYSVEIPEGDAVPDFINLRRKDGSLAGFITVYYDNVLVVCQDRDAAEWWRAKLYDNGKLSGAQWKRPEKGPAIAGPDRHVAYIGVEYAWVGDTLTWRWPEQNRGDFEKETHDPLFPDEWTPRMIYSWLGLRMWVARIAEIPFFKIGEEMSLIGQIQRMASETSWDTPLTEDEFKELRAS